VQKTYVIKQIFTNFLIYIKLCSFLEALSMFVNIRRR